MIELQHVSAGYGAQDVVRDVSFAAPNGQLTALIGPNGSGKTTLLRAMTRTLPCRSGNILLDDRSIASYGRKEFARTAAFMPQSRPVPFWMYAPSLSCWTCCAAWQRAAKPWCWLCTSCPRPCSMRIALPCWVAAACLAAIPPLPLLPPVRWIGCLASVCAVRRMGCGM